MKNAFMWLSLFTLVFLSQVSQAKDTEVMCLAKNIYYEAGAEPLEGKMAVAQVTMNRVEHPSFPKTVCGVVNQKVVRKSNSDWEDDKRTCQFSWVCQGRRIIKKESDNWQESLEIAKSFLTENKSYDKFEDDVLFFHEKHLPFNWKQKYTKVAVIGNHIFYRKKDAHQG